MKALHALAGGLLGLWLAACHEAGEAPLAGDYAVLAQAAQGFEQARPGRPLTFPGDHGPHPRFRIEWWYMTANLEDEDGRAWGAQWTLFRTASAPPREAASDNPWQDPQVYMAHLAISSPDGHRALQRYARGGDHGGRRRAGVRAEPFAAWLDDWEMSSTGPGWLPLLVRSGQGDLGLRLHLDSDRPPVLQGEGGFSRKHADGGGSHYYSHPWLRARGELRMGGKSVAVTGEAWLDREWSSRFLAPDQAGWDWLALHLDSGEKLMLFRLRSNAAGGDFLHGSLWAPDGARTVLDPEGIGLSVTDLRPVANRVLPLAWRIDLPQVGRSMDVRALHPDQWMDVDFAYWEGVVLATGDGPRNSGRGYLELTGYPVAP